MSSERLLCFLYELEVTLPVFLCHRFANSRRVFAASHQCEGRRRRGFQCGGKDGVSWAESLALAQRQDHCGTGHDQVSPSGGCSADFIWMNPLLCLQPCLETIAILPLTNSVGAMMAFEKTPGLTRRPMLPECCDISWVTVQAATQLLLDS